MVKSIPLNPSRVQFSFCLRWYSAVVQKLQSLCKTWQSEDPSPPRKGVRRSFTPGEWEGVTATSPHYVFLFPKLGEPLVSAHQRFPKDTVQRQQQGWTDDASSSLATCLSNTHQKNVHGAQVSFFGQAPPFWSELCHLLCCISSSPAQRRLRSARAAPFFTYIQLISIGF